MKILNVLILVFIVSILNSNAQFKTRIYNIHTEIPFNHAVDFGGTIYSTSEWSLGGNVCVGNKYLNTIVEYNYHSINLENVIGSTIKSLDIHELLLGLRYYPARPTFLAGKTAFRLTGGWKGGFDLDMNTKSSYFLGFGITGIRKPSGVLIQLQFNNGAGTNGSYYIQPYWGIKLGLVLGPSPK